MSEGENMVERLAKVLWNARIAPGGGGRTLMPWPFCPEHDWCVNTARAVIEALMTPTPEMIEAGVQVTLRDVLVPRGEKVAAIFQAMLRTSLSKPNEEGEGK